MRLLNAPILYLHIEGFEVHLWIATSRWSLPSAKLERRMPFAGELHYSPTHGHLVVHGCSHKRIVGVPEALREKDCDLVKRRGHVMLFRGPLDFQVVSTAKGPEIQNASAKLYLGKMT